MSTHRDIQTLLIAARDVEHVTQVGPAAHGREGDVRLTVAADLTAPVVRLRVEAGQQCIDLHLSGTGARTLRRALELAAAGSW
jgi:tRNA G26 N,N-dimethylase Trm1